MKRDSTNAIADVIGALMDERDHYREALERIAEVALRVEKAFTAEAEDWNDGEFALWRKDDLVNALVALRQERKEIIAEAKRRRGLF